MRVLVYSLVAGLLALSTVMPATVSADAGDVGVEGPSYTGASANPTGEKPESKTWFNDGSWWGSLWDTASLRYEIFKFNPSTNPASWTSTNIPLDTRSNSRADTLWDGSTLYVASHVFSKSPAAGYPSKLYVFTYAAGVYTSAGSPTVINNVRSESLVIDKDSTGQLWATWVQGVSGSRTVWVNRTTTGTTWGTPVQLPVNGVSVADDDISSIVAFRDGTTPSIGVFWSNQKGSSFHFAVHGDAAADTTWKPSVAVYPGSGNADDHINLKSLVTDGSGRVFAVVKTSKTVSSAPSIVLLARSTSAAWSARTIWTRSNDLTRPIVLIDAQQGRIHAFAAKEGGGAVYTKTSSLSAIGFASGLGTTVMLDASASDINDPTSTKQTVSSATGLLVLASNQTTKRYWHHYDPLGGA